MKPHFVMFAAYNRWANERLYEAAARIGEDKYRADKGAFFGSLHATLNHLVVTDRIWMRRFTGEGPLHTQLDEIIAPDLESLGALRREEDERIIVWIDSLAEADLAALITYGSLSNPARVAQPLATALAHLFNHQTHHRGQAHVLLTMQSGRDAAPSLDLVAFQRATGIGLG